MTSLKAVTYAVMVTAVESDDVDALKQLLQSGADVNANLDDDIGINCNIYYSLHFFQRSISSLGFNGHFSSGPGG